MTRSLDEHAHLSVRILERKRRMQNLLLHFLLTLFVSILVIWFFVPRAFVVIPEALFSAFEWHVLTKLNPESVTDADLKSFASKRFQVESVLPGAIRVAWFSLFFLCTSSAVHAAYGIKTRRKKTDVDHLRGQKLAEVSDLNEQTTAQIKKRFVKSSLDKARHVLALSLHGLATLTEPARQKTKRTLETTLKLGREGLLIPPQIEGRHFAFIGASGYGKSTAISEIIAQARARGDKGIIVDPGGRFHHRFGNQDDYILSLGDRRTQKWSFWSENGVNKTSMAASLIETKSSEKSFFVKGPRKVLSDLLEMTSTLEELWAYLRAPPKELREELEKGGYISGQIVGRGGGEQTDGVVASLTLDLGFITELNQWNESLRGEFSICEWMHDNSDRGWIFLTFDPSEIEKVQPLLRVWFDLAANSGLKRDDSDPDNIVQTWLVCDELRSLGNLPSLGTVLEQGRKFGLTLVTGFQSPGQLEDVYGREAKSIKQGLQLKFFFQNNEWEAQEFASKTLSEQEITERNTSVGFGSRKESESGSVSQRTTRRRLVLPSEIDSLDDRECFAKLAHLPPVRLSFEPGHTPQGRCSFESGVNAQHIKQMKMKSDEIISAMEKRQDKQDSGEKTEGQASLKETRRSQSTGWSSSALQNVEG